MRPHCLLASLALLAMGSCVHGRASLSDGGAGGQGGSTGGDGGQVASVGGGGAGGMGGAGGAEGGGGNEPGCGDGVLDPVDEQCDDGNQIPQDGCDPSCNVECAAGWFDAATNHCYRMIASSATWHDARDGCTSLSPGYDLAALSSDAELTFVVGQLSAALRFWIGGNDLQTEGTFTWSNGEDWSYTAWGLDEPNDTTPGEDCVEMRQLNAEWVWNDLPCTSTTPTAFLCELTPAGSP